MALTSHNKSCQDCGQNFQVTCKNKEKKFCSETCRKKHVGGYREGSGRSKHGYYNHIFCGSTYELCWVIYNLDHGIKFSRFPGSLSVNGLKYYPDFLLNDGKTIIEIKGFEDPNKTNRKTKLAELQGYVVNVLYKEDLQYIFEYVEKKHGTRKFWELYDTPKFLYDLVCHNCKCNFSSNTRRRTLKEVFCSRVCAGKYRAIVNHGAIV